MLPILVLGLIAASTGAATTSFLLVRHRADTGAPQVPHQPSPSTQGQSPNVSSEGAHDPAKESVVVLPVAAVILAVAVVLISVLILMIERHIGLERWDNSVESWAARHASATSTNFIEAITHLGDTLTVLLVSVATAIYAYARTRRLGIPAFLLVVVVGQWVLANVIKLTVARARPDLDPLASFSGSSFPSGHSTAAAATYLAVALVLGVFVHRRGQALFMGIGVAIAVAVACSRALLGVHWLTDVIGGLILGWSWFALCSVTFGGRRFAFGAGVRDIERGLHEDTLR